MFVLIASYLLLVFVLPVALSAIVSYRSLPCGRRCPQCGGDTIQVQSRVLAMLTRLHPRTRLHRRWCLECGWEGSSRLPRRSRVRTGPAVVRGPDGTQVEARAQTLDLRTVTLDGHSFRVMLQCWSTTGAYFGRLVFVGGSGRLWLDAVEAFSGSTETEVLGQALSLPDGLLENRLRRLVSRR